jgi:poly-beta-hydroxybutyrate-responsive repressor
MNKKHGCHSDCESEGGCRCRGGLLRGFIQPRLLFLLAQHPAHGYELMETLNKTEDLASADAGNLYRMLNNLESHGFVHSQWDVGESGPARKVYELTEAGRADLAAWVEGLRQAQSKLADFISEYEEFTAREGKKGNEPKK